MSNKKHMRTVTVIRYIADIVATILAWEFSYYIRFYLMESPSGGAFLRFLYFSLLMAIFVIFFSTRNHLYETHRYYAWYREFLLVIKSQLQSVATFIIILYFAWPHRLSRITIGLYILMSLITGISIRGIIRCSLRKAQMKGYNLCNTLILGQGKALGLYVKALSDHSEKGVKFIAWIGSPEQAKEHGITEMNIEDISLHDTNAPDTVIIGYDAATHHTLDESLAIFNKTAVNVFIVPDIENAFIGYTINDFYGVPLISVNAPPLNTFHLSMKRSIDLFGSFLGLVFLSPLFLLIAFLVKLTSKGPIFFGQERMTRDSKTFIMWKFRSMRTDAESEGAKWATAEDDRCTKLGRLLRRTSLDELPQLWNVFVGDMSLVGPRPERPVFIEKFKHEIPSYMLRHRMKSGITGWAQVNGWRGNTSITKRIEFDVYYIRNWSIFLDVKILILTLIHGFIHENAY